MLKVRYGPKGRGHWTVNSEQRNSKGFAFRCPRGHSKVIVARQLRDQILQTAIERQPRNSKGERERGGEIRGNLPRSCRRKIPCQRHHGRCSSSPQCIGALFSACLAEAKGPAVQSSWGLGALFFQVSPLFATVVKIKLELELERRDALLAAAAAAAAASAWTIANTQNCGA